MEETNTPAESEDAGQSMGERENDLDPTEYCEKTEEYEA